MFEHYDTVINRLKIRGSARDSERIGRELHNAHWPETANDSWVFVRQIKTKAPADRITRDIIEQARNYIEHIDPGNVVRFASLDELLAALLEDLVRSPAQPRWYWKPWEALFTQPKSQAIAGLLAEHLPLLNAITQQLSIRQRLTEVWTALEPGDARQLIKELAWKNQYPLQSFNLSGSTTTVPISIPEAIRQRWLGALIPFDWDDARVQLALILIAQEIVPLALMQSPEQTLASIASQVTPGQSDFSHRKNEEPYGQQPGSEDISIASTTDQSDLQQPIARTAEEPIKPSKSVSNEHKNPVLSADKGSVTEQKTPQPSVLAQTQQLTDNELKAHSSSAPAEQTSEPQSSHRLHPNRLIQIRTDTPSIQPDRFQTEQGGVLYLLNFLNRQPLQELMGEHWRQLPNGWIWLYRVAQLLAFDESDPLSAFIAQQIGLENTGQLQGLPTLPEKQQILHWAGQWYAGKGLWSSSLLMLPATIRHNPSHIDMHTGLSEVRLEVRLAGLDINPGWLPWLGRVVQFHFDDEAGHE